MDKDKPDPIIGDFVVSTDYENKQIPVSVPVKIVGIELDPSANYSSWKDLPEEIRISGDPFYVVEFPDILQGSLSLGFLKIKNTELFVQELVSAPIEEKDDFYSNEDFFKYD
jgi:hypothetical protein